MNNRPNVLFIVSDQHRASLLGSAGDPHIRTPHLDALAAAGTRFDAAYCPSPLCGPSRAAFMTGLLPIRSHVFMNADSLPSHLPTIAHSLTAAGYHSILCGRMHFVGPDQRHGFKERLVGDFGATDVSRIPTDYGIFQHTTGQDARRLAQSSGPGRSNVMQFDDDVTEAACQTLLQYQKEDPLFLTVGLYGPHNPYTCERELFDHYNRVLPRVSDDAVDSFAAHAHPAIQNWIKSRHLPGLDPAVRHAARAGYYGLVERLDGLVGRIVASARQRFGDDLLIIYISDHGDMAGQHGLFWKSTFFEGAAKVPFLCSGPSILQNQSPSTPVSLLDLAPTLADLVKAEPFPDTDGISLAPTLREGKAPDPQRPVLATLTDRTRGRSAMVRKGHYKLIDHQGFEQPELYNLADDPAEINNLGNDPAQLNRIHNLRQHFHGNWDPDREQRHAESAQQRNQLLQHWANQTNHSPAENWQCRPQNLWFENPHS